MVWGDTLPLGHTHTHTVLRRRWPEKGCERGDGGVEGAEIGEGEEYVDDVDDQVHALARLLRSVCAS